MGDEEHSHSDEHRVMYGIATSLHCTLETNGTLCGNDTGIKIKKNIFCMFSLTSVTGELQMFV